MIALLIACAGVSPSLEVGDDAMLAALPADVTVVGGIDAAALVAPDADDLLADAGLAREDGDAIRFGCGWDGCAALAEGRFGELRRPAVSLPRSRERAHGFDVPTGLGRVAVRRLDSTRLVAGDPAALRRVALGGSTFDLASLDGRVPDGDAWVLLRDPATLSEQAAWRLDGRAADLAEQVRAAWAEHGDEAARVESVAVAWDDGTVRVRAICVDAASCRGLATRFRAWRLLHPEVDGRLVVDGAVLELTHAR